MFNSPELDELVNKMVYTMTMFDGVGLAAPQVGESLRLLVLEQDHVDPTPRCVVYVASPNHRKEEAPLIFSTNSLLLPVCRCQTRPKIT